MAFCFLCVEKQPGLEPGFNLAAALRALDADPAIVRDLTTKVRSIRASIGTEMGEDDRDVQRIVKKRADEAISIMESLAALQPSTFAGLREMLPSLDQCNLAAFLSSCTCHSCDFNETGQVSLKYRLQQLYFG